MKRIVFSLIFILYLFSCAEENQPADTEIPAWLQDIIEQNEEELKKDEGALVSITAWVRFTYRDAYYFEYHNPILSSMPPVHDWEGTLVQFDQESFDDYSQQKCCKWYVWKGPSYFLDN